MLRDSEGFLVRIRRHALVDQARSSDPEVPAGCPDSEVALRVDS